MFTINDVEWNLCFVDKNDSIFTKADGTITIGVTDRNLKMIFISDALKGVLLRKVLTHEICHACIFSYGIYLDLMQEEYICEFVANYGAEILQNVDAELQSRGGSTFRKIGDCI